MAINTHENLLFSKTRAKQKVKSQKIAKQNASDLQSFTGGSIYETNKKSKIDSNKLKNSFLSNISFAGTSNAVSFGSGGYSGYSGGGYSGGTSSGPSSSQSTQRTNPTQSSQKVQGTNRAETVSGVSSSEKVIKMRNEKDRLLKQYKDLQAVIKDLDNKKKEAVEMLATIRNKVHTLNMDIMKAEEEDLFG